MSRRRLTILAAAASAVAVLVPATFAAAAPTAQKSVENEALLAFLTTGKLKVKSSMVVQFVCSADCSATSAVEFKIPGPNVSLPPLTDTFLANTPGGLELTPNKSLRSFMKKNIKKSKLKVEISATNVLTGDTDTDSVTFKLKK